MLLDDHLDGQVLQGEGRGEYRDLRLDAEPAAGYDQLERGCTRVTVRTRKIPARMVADRKAVRLGSLG